MRDQKKAILFWEKEKTCLKRPVGDKKHQTMICLTLTHLGPRNTPQAIKKIIMLNFI